MQGESISFELLEEFLSVPELLEGHFWLREQTLFALCSSKHGAEHLPGEYRVSLEKGIHGRPVKHYVGAIRQLMYSEGMRKLTRDGMLAAR